VSGLAAHSSRRRLAALAALVLASAFGVALVAVRLLWTGEADYANLVWNLVLAWVPLLLALVVYDRSRRRDATRDPLVLACAALWLVFLPNAPYLATEYMFLRIVDGMPVWFDVAMLTTFAWTGLLLGFTSVYLVQQAVSRAAGTLAGWLCAVGALGLAGLGVYLGRYLRWNSWDLFVQPGGVLGDVAHRLTSTRMVGMTLVTATFLTLAYGMLYAFLQVALDERAEQRTRIES